MTNADAIVRRSIYQGFAYSASAFGFALFAWGPLWFGTELGGEPYMKAPLVRTLAAIVVAHGCFAAPPPCTDCDLGGSSKMSAGTFTKWMCFADK